ncbi:VTT domain-containing protein [Aquiflexum sp. TKW24L]|uniref:TVP38/TMEM64 family protein n=1 Tax=Aquiflexum sp. TKW24L TaxID=2942212 RepID=UPI0020BD4BFD|nr:VTT domain-containing protein [Aquiflexum sp. TKW24L]MCL6260191.1 VTT domain-containing protein [Aquiflexum sp. TKW24L]
MEKKQGIFKEFQSAYRINPAVALALVWVAVMPSLGSLLGFPVLVHYAETLSDLDFLSFFTAPVYLIIVTLLMGFALMPTTLVAGLSGFIFGWEAFPFLFLAYNFASVLGYGWGKKLGGESLDLILDRYPKAKNLIEAKRNRMGELIFFGRLSPILPFAVSNLLFSVLHVGWKKLVLFGSIGMLPRTIITFSAGTLGSNIYGAINQEGISGKAWIFIFLLLLSVWGIWRFFVRK